MNKILVQMDMAMAVVFKENRAIIFLFQMIAIGCAILMYCYFMQTFPFGIALQLGQAAQPHIF